VVFVKLELCGGRAILRHRFDDLGDAGAAAFGKFQFLEKFADAAISVTAGDSAAQAELIKAD
jgi:hypothetical protein